MEITTEMLEAAIKAGVKAGVLPKNSDTETYMKIWDGVRKMLEAALSKD